MRPWASAALLVLVVPLLSAGLSAEPATLVTTAWDTLPPVPVARTEVTAVAASGKLYVMGGLGAGNAGGARVDVFDPATNAWSAGPPLPTPLHHTQAVAIGPRILVLGGYSGLIGAAFTPIANVWMLDTSVPAAAQAWVPFGVLPEPRGAHAAATDGSSVWIFGGVGPAPNQLAARAYRMDSVAGVPVPAWVPIANFPDVRDHLAGAFLGGKVYAVGGRDLTLGSNTGRLDAYDPATNAWAQLAPMPTPRGGIGAAALAGRVWVFGGEANGGVTFSAAEGFDPASGWAAGAPMPTSRHGLGVAQLGGHIYVEAGGPIAGLTVTDKNERMRVLG